MRTTALQQEIDDLDISIQLALRPLCPPTAFEGHNVKGLITRVCKTIVSQQTKSLSEKESLQENINVRTALLKALRLAAQIKKDRKIGYDDRSYADPIRLMSNLEKYPLTDLPTLTAGILYPVLRGGEHTPFDHDVFATIQQAYANKPEIANITREALQIREISILMRIAGRTTMQREEYPNDQWMQKFRHMIINKIDDPYGRPLLLRAKQFLEYSQSLDERADPEKLDFAKFMLKKFYIPITGTLSFPTEDVESITYKERRKCHTFAQLQRGLQNELFRLSKPAAYAEAHNVLFAGEEAMLDTIDKSDLKAATHNGESQVIASKAWFDFARKISRLDQTPDVMVADPATRERLALEAIKQKFSNALNQASYPIVDNEEDLAHYTNAIMIRVRRKTEESLWEKTFRKDEGRQIGDAFGCEIIVKTYDEHREHGECAKVVAVLKTLGKSAGLFEMPEEEDDLMGGRLRPKANEDGSIDGNELVIGKGSRTGVGSKKSGYSAIHMMFALAQNKPDLPLRDGHNPVRMGVVELHITGHQMWLENNFGQAAHTTYKGHGCPIDPKVKEGSHIFVSGDGRTWDIRHVPAGTTSDGLLKQVGVFEPAEVVVQRTDPFAPYPVEPNDPLVTGDRATLFRPVIIPS